MNIAILALVATCMFFVRAGLGMHKRRTGRHAVGKELAFLAHARAVEHQAKALLADNYEGLVLHDTNAAFDTRQIGYGKGVLAARIAASGARGAQRQLEWGEDFVGAHVRLNVATKAFATALETTGLAKIMMAVKGRTRYPHLREVSGID